MNHEWESICGGCRLCILQWESGVNTTTVSVIRPYCLTDLFVIAVKHTSTSPSLSVLFLWSHVTSHSFGACMMLYVFDMEHSEDNFSSKAAKGLLVVFICDTSYNYLILSGLLIRVDEDKKKKKTQSVPRMTQQSTIIDVYDVGKEDLGRVVYL